MTRMVRTARPAHPSPELIEALDTLALGRTLAPIVYKEDDEEGGASKVDHVAIIAKYKAKVTNRSSAIRAKCVEGSGGILSEVRECGITACALHPFRLGTDPNNKKTLDRLAKQAANSGTTEGEE